MTKLIIQKNNDEQKQIALIEEGKLAEYYEENIETQRKEGNIYIAIVRNIIKGMQAAFVDIGTEKNSFIYVKDILKKEDETKENKNKEIKDITEVITISKKIENIKERERLLKVVKDNINKDNGAIIRTSAEGKEETEIIKEIK